MRPKEVEQLSPDSYLEVENIEPGRKRVIVARATDVGVLHTNMIKIDNMLCLYFFLNFTYFKKRFILLFFRYEFSHCFIYWIPIKMLISLIWFVIFVCVSVLIVSSYAAFPSLTMESWLSLPGLNCPQFRNWSYTSSSELSLPGDRTAPAPESENTCTRFINTYVSCFLLPPCVHISVIASNSWVNDGKFQPLFAGQGEAQS